MIKQQWNGNGGYIRVRVLYTTKYCAKASFQTILPRLESQDFVLVNGSQLHSAETVDANSGMLGHPTTPPPTRSGEGLSETGSYRYPACCWEPIPIPPTRPIGSGVAGDESGGRGRNALRAAGEA